MPQDLERRNRCQCGRLTFPPHCPFCGSGSIYGKRTNEVRIKDEKGNLTIGRGFICRRCQEDFDTTIECVAPPINHPSRPRPSRMAPPELVEQILEGARRAKKALEERTSSQPTETTSQPGQDVDQPGQEKPTKPKPTQPSVETKDPENWRETNPMFEDKDV